MLTNLLLIALMHITPVTGTLTTPNPDNDEVQWEESVDPDLSGYSVYFSANGLSPWIPVGLVDKAHNHWKEPTMSMSEGYYCVRAVDLSLNESVNCSTPIYWAPCAQWNVDIEMTAACVTETCLMCITFAACPFETQNGELCCSEQAPVSNCTVQICSPPIPADWPSEPCADPGVEIITPPPTMLLDTEWTRRE